MLLMKTWTGTQLTVNAVEDINRIPPVSLVGHTTACRIQDRKQLVKLIAFPVCSYCCEELKDPSSKI